MTDDSIPSDGQLFARSNDDHMLVLSYLAEEGFTESEAGAFVQEDQVKGDLSGYNGKSLVWHDPSYRVIESSLNDLAKEELVDQRSASNNTDFYRLNSEGEDAYDEIRELENIDELDALYEPDVEAEVNSHGVGN